jgi:rod shape determining protein RodA
MISRLDKVKIDLWLFLPLMLISFYGIIVLYSASDQSIDMIQSQVFKLMLGFGLMILVSQIDPIKIRVWGARFYFLVLGLLVLVELFGHTAMGATRWLDLGVISLQPSELMKLSLPMMLGWMIYRNGMPRKVTDAALYAALIFVPTALVLRQPDLGTSILIVGSGLFLLFQAGLSYFFISMSAIFMASASPFLWYALKEYQQRRILSLFDAESDPQGAGYHIIQSKTAIGAGGNSGTGYLEGTQTHLGYVPEQHTDFIFTVLAEEFGFQGVVILLIMYLFVVFRLFKIIVDSQDIYQKLVTGSVMMVFFAYVFVNIGMVSGLLPVVGVPLPLFSFGGTSVIVLLLSFGIISSFSSHRVPSKRVKLRR